MCEGNERMEVCASPLVLSSLSAKSPVLIPRVLSSPSAKSPVLREYKTFRLWQNKTKLQEVANFKAEVSQGGQAKTGRKAFF